MWADPVANGKLYLSLQFQSDRSVCYRPKHSTFAISHFLSSALQGTYKIPRISPLFGLGVFILIGDGGRIQYRYKGNYFLLPSLPHRPTWNGVLP
jgi:hypothetical protein